MSSKVEKLEKNVVKLEITVDAATFEQGMQKAYLKNVKKFNIPGFRKGKAPRNIIEKFYGEGVLFEDAINIVCPDAYDIALKEHNLDAVEQPEIDVVEIGKGKDLIFTAKVTLKPEVKLGKYKGIEVEKPEIKITVEQVNEKLEELRGKNARIIDVEDRAVKDDDIAVIDFEGFVDGVAFPGGKGEGYELTIGSGQFIPGFEEQLVGAKIGESVDVNVKFPEEYHAEELAGKDALFKVKVNAIKFRELPKLDDEFAKDVSEFDTLADLKKDIKEKLQHDAEHHAKHEFENNVIKFVSENAEMDIPEAMIERQIQDLARDFAMRLKYQGLDLNKYLQLTGMSPENFKNDLRPQAVEQVRGRLTLEAISKAENIDATEEEVEAETSKLAENYRQNVEHFKQHLKAEDIQYIKEGLVFDKVIAFLVENAKTSKKK